MLNGEKHRELCPDNGVLSASVLSDCVLKESRALLRRDGGAPSGNDSRVLLPFERGSAVLSEFQCTTSSEALLAGKQPTFK